MRFREVAPASSRLRSSDQTNGQAGYPQGVGRGCNAAETLAATPTLSLRYKDALRSRREFLLTTAGGLAALFAPVGTLAATANPWSLLAATQNHLFPSELGAPGAREINALSYLQGVLGDPRGDRDEQRFILKGVDWLEDLSRQRHKTSFVDLDPIRREQVLREVANSRPGENWLSTLLLYLCEALLTDPVYGGNPDGIGWAWLEHQPGFPRPTHPPRKS